MQGYTEGGGDTFEAEISHQTGCAFCSPIFTAFIMMRKKFLFVAYQSKALCY